MFATRIGARIADRPVTPLGQAGLRPNGTAREDFDADEILRAVREQMLPLNRNFFRRDVTLYRSLNRLDACWADLRRHGSAEAAAMTATSRWAYRSALARTESRGMHRRGDMPNTDPGFACSLHTSGVDDVHVARADARTIASSSGPRDLPCYGHR